MQDSDRAKHLGAFYTLAYTPRHLRTTGHGGCKVLVDALVVRLAEVKMQTLGEALVEVEAKELVDTSFETPQEKHTQLNSEAHFDRLAKRLSECKIRQLATHCQRLTGRR